MTDEYEVLDAVWDAFPVSTPHSVTLYPMQGKMTRPEMYIKINGECWRILAERHPHPLEDDWIEDPSLTPAEKLAHFESLNPQPTRGPDE